MNVNIIAKNIYLRNNVRSFHQYTYWVCAVHKIQENEYYLGVIIGREFFISNNLLLTKMRFNDSISAWSTR
jgi:hypothetical protein